MNFNDYTTNGFYDELIAADGSPRNIALPLINHINSLPKNILKRRQKAAELALLNLGITFGVYGNKKKMEKIFPFDILPRIISSNEWQILEKGLKQRIHALNLFINDIYSEQKIVKSGFIPKELIYSASSFRHQCIGLTPPENIWIHITGTDLIRNDSGQFLVLEDNVRCPSGISYVLENRATLKKTFPYLFKTMKVRHVSDYCDQLYQLLTSVAPKHVEEPKIALLTPGVFNSAYFEHAYLAQQMGIPLVEGRDLVVIDDHVNVRTTAGLERIDVIYRRIDDDYLDPTVFLENSLLGVPGLIECYKKGNVTLANAPGTGIADDKAIYAYTTNIIKYYLDEDPIIPIVETFLCEDKTQQDYVIKNLEKLVVKAVNMSGGYGMLIGPASTKSEREKFAELIKAKPRNYIAQPTISLSRAPSIINDQIVGRHIDFRPYILFGKTTFVLPGGLTRVALRENSLVVNSSQGGGSKDTWVLEQSRSECVE